MLSVIGFIVVLIPLVVVHEFGHFLFAKLFGVRADAFSIGFGPVILKKQVGETEFRLSAIPLGGYVKLLGEDPTAPLSDAEKKRALHHQVAWKRFFIFFGGPLFNFIWAALVFMFMMALGEPQISTVVGRVLRDTPAARSGFLPGDKITTIDGEPVVKFDEIFMKLNDKPDRDILVGIERGGSPLQLKTHTVSEEGFSVYGEKKQIGMIDGIVPSGRMTKIGVSSPQSLAAKNDLKTGDEILAINGAKVETFEQLEQIYSKLGKSSVELKIKSGDQTRDLNLTGKFTGDLGRDYGIFSSELFVEQAMKDTPAERAGIKKGDQLIAVSGKAIHSFFELRHSIQKAGEEKGQVAITVMRQGKPVTFDLVPQTTTDRDPMLKNPKQFTIGVMPIPTMIEPVMVKEQTLNPFTLVYKGFSRMIDMSERNLVSILKMVQGHVSVKSLGGPIQIGKLAGDSLSRGFMDFLRMMAMLSVGLGVLNILPIPVLDGGHIVLLGIEVIRGRALSLKQIEIAQQVGLVLILMIMVVAMKNDISRLPIFN